MLSNARRRCAILEVILMAVNETSCLQRAAPAGRWRVSLRRRAGAGQRHVARERVERGAGNRSRRAGCIPCARARLPAGATAVDARCGAHGAMAGRRRTVFVDAGRRGGIHQHPVAGARARGSTARQRDCGGVATRGPRPHEPPVAYRHRWCADLLGAVAVFTGRGDAGGIESRGGTGRGARA